MFLPEDFFVSKSFAFYRLFVTRALGVEVVFTYEVLRQYAWRGALPAGSLEARLRQQGYLVSRCSQELLGKHLGVSRQTAAGHVRALKTCGWIEVVSQGGEYATVLGRVVREGDHKVELFYADSWLASLLEFVLDKCAESHRARRDQEHPEPGERPKEVTVPEQLRWLNSVPPEQLAAYVLDFIGTFQQNRGLPLSARPTPPCRPRRHPLSARPTLK